MKKRILLVVPFAVLVIGLAVVVGRAAAQGDGSGLIVLCVDRSDGTVRKVDRIQQCRRARRGDKGEAFLFLNERHPVLALFGSNVVDLTVLDGDDKIIRFGPDFEIVGTPDYLGTGDIGFLFNLPAVNAAGLGLGLGVGLPGDELHLTADQSGANRVTLWMGTGDGDGWSYDGLRDQMQLLNNDAPIMHFEDGIVDMRGSSADSWMFKIGDGAQFGFERGLFGGYVFTNDNAEEPGLNKIMFRNSADGISFNEFHFRESGVAFASGSFEFVDEETGGFTADVTIDDNLLDVSNSDLSLQLYDCDNNVAPDIANGTFGFCVDQTSGITYMILELGGTVLRMDMSDFEPFP